MLLLIVLGQIQKCKRIYKHKIEVENISLENLDLSYFKICQDM